MEPVTLALRTQPTTDRSGSGYMARQIGDATNLGVLNDDAFNLGIELSPERIEFGPDRVPRSEVELLSGDTKLYRRGIPKRTVRVDLSCLPVADMRVLEQMLRSGRPLSFGAWYDASTVWMSHFGGKGGDLAAIAGTAEVGNAESANVTRRDAVNDFSPDPFASWNILRNWPTDATYSNKRVKLAPGMIGAAAVFDSARTNKALRRMSAAGTTLWQAGGAAVVGKSTEIFQPFAGLSVPAEVATIKKGTDYADYLTAGTSTGLSVGVTYTVTTYVRGHGTAYLSWVESFSVKASTEIALTDEWQRVQVVYAATATSAEMRLYPKPGGSSIVIQAAGCQVEAGYGPTSFLNTGDATSVADTVLLDSPINFGAGLTVVAWVQWRNDADYKFLFSGALGSAGYHLDAFVTGTTLRFEWETDYADQTATGATAGSWTQLVLTLEAGASSPSTMIGRWYVNGVAMASPFSFAAPDFYPSATGQLFYLGSGHGCGTPLEYGLQMPLDSFRIDERVWSAAEVLNDYNRRTDAGIRGLLQALQGRYFKTDWGIRPHGPFVDVLDGSLSLVEVETRLGSVP